MEYLMLKVAKLIVDGDAASVTSKQPSTTQVAHGGKGSLKPIALVMDLTKTIVG
jgi:hypothetical protein